MRLKEIEARLFAIKGELETRGAEITSEEITKLETEIRSLQEEKAQLIEQQEKRQALLNSVANAEAPLQGEQTRILGTPANTPTVEVDKYDTPEYRNAFMNYICRGVPISTQLRADAFTTTTDASATIPTTLLNEIVKKMESYGNIFSKVRKMNIQGGVEIPILSIKPTATWITEAKTSDVQKLQANTKISFNYYGLECKIGQTLLASVVTYDAFQSLFSELSVEAIIKLCEIAIFKGTGSGQPTGVTVDSRVPTKNVITIPQADFGKWETWHKQVISKMGKSYRNGAFVMAQGTFDGHIVGMVDSTGQPIGRVNYGIDGSAPQRFAGFEVETVEDDIIANYDTASAGDVIAVFMKFSDYAFNSNMALRNVKWTDEDTNQVKIKSIMICDGKLIDPNGVLIIKKGTAPASS